MNIARTPVMPGRVYIIAEIGVNHDGSAHRALQLTDAAADAGVDAVKLQLFQTDRLMSRSALLAAYQKSSGESDPIAMLRRLELSIGDMEPVVERAHARGIHAIVTVFSTELVALSERLAWDAYKVASPDLIHRPLLEALAATQRPLILSTGASEMEEVQRTLGWLGHARSRLAVLQCVSSYPTPDSALDGMIDLAQHLPGLPVGYSDHTPGVATGAAAVESGALLLEKHLTYDTGARGPDHSTSLTPAQMGEYVRLARSARAISALGPRPGAKRVLEPERDVRVVSRQSLVSRRALPAGSLLTPDDLTIKRPGTGIPPFELGSVVGRRLALGVEADTVLTWTMIEGARSANPRPELSVFTR